MREKNRSFFISAIFRLLHMIMECISPLNYFKQIVQIFIKISHFYIKFDFFLTAILNRK